MYGHLPVRNPEPVGAPYVTQADTGIRVRQQRYCGGFRIVMRYSRRGSVPSSNSSTEIVS